MEKSDEIYNVEKIFLHGDSIIAVLTVPEEYFNNLSISGKKKSDVRVGVIDENLWYVNVDRILLLFSSGSIELFSKNPVLYIYVFNENSPREYVCLNCEISKESLVKISGILEYLRGKKSKVEENINL